MIVVNRCYFFFVMSCPCRSLPSHPSSGGVGGGPHIHHRHNEAVEQGRGGESAEDDLGHGALYLVAREVATEGERDECQGGGEGGHEDGVQAVGRAVHDAIHHRVSLGTQVVVAFDEQHTIACGDTEERDESDDGGDTHLTSRSP